MNRRLVIILAAVGLLATALWWFMLWSPRNEAIAEANDRRQLAQDQISQLQAQLVRLQQAQRDEPRRRAELEVLKAAVPDTPALAELILGVNDLAIRSGVEFATISVSVPSPGSPSTMSTSINVTGGYFQILDVINRINALPRLIIIDSFALTPSQAGESQEFSVTFACRAFTRAQEISPSTTAPPPTTVGGTAPTTVTPSSTTVVS